MAFIIIQYNNILFFSITQFIHRIFHSLVIIIFFNLKSTYMNCTSTFVYVKNNQAHILVYYALFWPLVCRIKNLIIICKACQNSIIALSQLL